MPAWALTISLSPLADDETALLIGELLEQPLLAAEVQSELLVRAGGNPLYAEQYARILLERGELAELPETVQGMIAARLDLLEPGQKALLQDAAVLGRTFWVGGVATVSGLDERTVEERLHALERKEFVRRERRSGVADETEYAFPHVLVRDVAYGQIPRAERAGKHRQAAEWIESLGRPEDLADVRAHHYLQALELAEAAGLDAAALVDPARHALRDAGDRSAALYAVEAAERFYDAALRLWTAHDSELAELLYRRALPVGRHIGGGDPARLAEALDALLAAGETDQAAEVETQLAQSFWIRGQHERVDEHYGRAMALLGEGPPTKSRAWVLARLASRAYLMGEGAQAIELVSKARDVSEQIGWEEGLSDSLSQLGMNRVTAGTRAGSTTWSGAQSSRWRAARSASIHEWPTASP